MRRPSPGYMTTLIDDVLEYSGLVDAPALEIGPGAGWSTTVLADRGVTLMCVEADQRSVESLRRRFTGRSSVTVVNCRFEDWNPSQTRSFGLLYSGQSWHLLDPEERLPKALKIMRPGGTIAISWNYVSNLASPFRRALAEVHDMHGLGCVGRMLLDNPAGDQDRSASAITEFDGLDAVNRVVRSYSWRAVFSRTGYLRVLSEFVSRGLITPADFDALQPGIMQTFDSFDSELKLEMVTKLYLIRCV
jgi:SAM-dependent methyltransferase